MNEIELGSLVKVKGQDRSPRYTVVGLTVTGTGVQQARIVVFQEHKFESNMPSLPVSVTVLIQNCEVFPVDALELVPLDVNGITVGKVVRLRSGGPDLTVISMQPDLDAVYCVWFEAGRKKADSFPLATLVLV